MINEAAQVPLLEQLRSVPKDWREMREVGYCAHRNVPYGRMLHEAADEIERLQRDAERYRWLRREPDNVDCCVESCYGNIEFYLTGDAMDAAVDATRHSAP